MISSRAKSILVLLWAVAWLAPVALACSAAPGGDPSGHYDRAAGTLGQISILPVLGTAVLYFLRRRNGLSITIASLVLFAIHPAWTLSAGGDCGITKMNYAKWFTGLLVLLAIIQFALWLLGRGSARPKLS